MEKMSRGYVVKMSLGCVSQIVITSQMRDGAFLRGGDRMYNVIREGEGQMNGLRRSSE